MILKNLQITTDVTLVVKDGILIEAHKLILGAMNKFSNAFRKCEAKHNNFLQPAWAD